MVLNSKDGSRFGVLNLVMMLPLVLKANIIGRNFL
jgi:hypothetical protein